MNMKLTVIKNAADAPLGEPTPAKLPIGELIAQSRLGQDTTIEGSGVSVGIWECSPGVFRRHIMNREFSHILSGWCIFTPDAGDPVELHAGDAVFFPANCEGVWDIRAQFRKTYVIF